MSTKDEAKTATHQIDFLVAVINLIKKFPESIDWFQSSLIKILLITQEVLIIPKCVNITQDRIYRKNEDLKTFRKDFLNIYQNLFNLKSLKDKMMSDVLSMMDSIKSGLVKDANEIELALFLISNIDNTGSMEADEFKLNVVNFLFTIDFTSVNSETILLLYLESLIKHLPVYLNNNQMVDIVAKLLVGEKGICFPHIKIAGKICSIMQKFVEKTRNCLDPTTCCFMINSIKGFLESIINSKNAKVMNDFAVIYQSFGVLINSPKLSNDSVKDECLVGVFNLFFKYFEGGIDNEKLNFVSKLILNFFKSFNSEIKTSKETFFNFFQSFYLNVYKKVQAEYDSKLQVFNSNMLTFINLLQKIVVILAKDSLWFIDCYLSTDFVNPTQEVFENTLKLMTGLSSTLKRECKEIVAKHFGTFFYPIKQLPFPKNNIADTDKSILNLYSSFIQLIYNISLDFVEIFFEAELRRIGITEFLMNVCTSIIDATTKRKSFNCLKSRVAYLAKFNSEENFVESNSILNLTIMLSTKLNLNDPTDFNVRI